MAAGRRRHFLQAQLHGSLTPAHADGCGAQCFVGVQCASIFNPARVSSPTSCHACFAAWCGSLAPMREVMAHRPYGSAQTGMYPFALYCGVGLPSGFLFQGTASGPQQREETGKGLSCFSLRGPVRHGIVTMEEMSLISRRRFMYSSTHT